LALGRFVATQLYGIKVNDPGIVAAGIVVLIVVAGLAGFIPANRASRIDPILALPYE
jgi:ABC-type antimicrobial peptide transport system permease subunit